MLETEKRKRLEKQSNQKSSHPDHGEHQGAPAQQPQGQLVAGIQAQGRLHVRAAEIQESVRRRHPLSPLCQLEDWERIARAHLGRGQFDGHAGSHSAGIAADDAGAGRTLAEGTPA